MRGSVGGVERGAGVGRVRGEREVVQHVDRPGVPGVEADEEVDRWGGAAVSVVPRGRRVRDWAAGRDGDAVDAPAPFVLCYGLESRGRARR